MSSQPQARNAATRAIQSMTGSGVASGATSLGEVSVECRSVNGRGLTVKMRLASPCQGLEAGLEAAVRSHLNRGTAYLTVAVTEPRADAEPVVDTELAGRVAETLEGLAAGLGKSFSLADVLAFPGVIPSGERNGPRVSRGVPQDLAALLASAMEQLLADRQREGRATVEMMQAEIRSVRANLEAVSQQAPKIAADYRDRLLQRVNEFLEGRARAMEDADVIREVAVFAERADISEEMQRLDAHMVKADELLGGSGPVGRNMEFLVQEMLREVNTLGSKSPDVSIAHRVVDMKASIDKLKEQAANLE